LFCSCFHVPHPGGAEHAAQEKATANDRKHLRLRRSQEKAERQRRGASLLYDDDDDEDEDTEADKEDLEVLQHILDASGGPTMGTDQVAPVTRRVLWMRAVSRKSAWLHRRRGV
jgi:hypothetical protein